MSAEYRAVRLDELDECLDLWVRAFPHTPREYFEPYFNGDPWFKPEYTRVCAVDGKLVSAVQICERKIRIGSAVVIMGGIGNVGTDPDFRGRGYSTQLLIDSVRTMHENGMDFSVLYTGINPFYERVGWATVPTPIRVSQLNEQEKPDINGYTVHLCDWERDLSSLMMIYDSFNHERTLTAVRTSEYWSGWAIHRFGKGSSITVAEKDGQVIGYLQSHHDGQNIWLREIAYLNEYEECAAVLINNAILEALKAGVRMLWSNLPDEQVITDYLDKISKSTEIRQTTGSMYRIINMESFADRLLPELSRRIRGIDLPNCSIAIETEMGTFPVSIQNGSVSSTAVDPASISLSQSDFFSLFFGYKSIDELDIRTETNIHKVLSVLFPKQLSASWAVDHF